MSHFESFSSWLLPEKPPAWHLEPEYLSYLQDLATYSLSQVQAEPDRLLQDRSQLGIDTQSLAYQNYRTFILTADCSSGILAQFDRVSLHLDSIVQGASDAKISCSEFVRRSAEVDRQRQRNSLVLSKHSELLEVLEIPQVMETCVRNGYYEEALELSHHMQRLSKRLKHIPLIQSIARDVSSTMDLMQSQLLQLLGTSIQLPACLKTIGYLRRMGVFEEGELRIKFLQTRNSWLQHTLSAIPSDDAYSYLGKLIETSRVHLFDVITQYRGIFPNDDPFILMTSSDADQNKRSYAHVFYGWIACKVGEFLHSLEAVLSSNPSVQRLDSLLSQSMYFGLSFSRIGADFRPMLVNIFHRTMFKTLSSHLSAASIDFREAMRHYILTPPYQTPHPPSSSSCSQAPRDPSKTPPPPHALLQFTPLARYLNQVLTTFNEVKQCPLTSLALPFRSALVACISAMVQSVCEFDARERSSYSEKERDLFIHFCFLTAYELIPFISSALLHMYPIDCVNEFLSRTPCAVTGAEGSGPDTLGLQTVKRVRVYTPLNSDKLGEPLKQLYPEEVQQRLRDSRRQSQQSSELALTQHTPEREAPIPIPIPDKLEENIETPTGETHSTQLLPQTADDAVI